MVKKNISSLIKLAVTEQATVEARVDVEPQSFLHMERRKRDLTLSLSFSLFLIRGNIFRVAILPQVQPHGRPTKGWMKAGGGMEGRIGERKDKERREDSNEEIH